MIPAVRWRRAAAGVVVAADVVVLLLAAVQVPGTVLFGGPVLALLTWWAVVRPGGWGPLAVVLGQVLVVATFGRVPESVLDWARAAVAAAVVLASHLAFALLAAWPPGAGLPTTTARRWVTQTVLLVGAGAVAAVVGAVAATTPLGFAPWVAGAALVALAVAATTLGTGARRRR